MFLFIFFLQPPIGNFGDILDGATEFLTPWRKKEDPERLKRIIDQRSMWTTEWQLYYGEPLTVEQVEKGVTKFRSNKKLSSDDRFILRWLEKNLRYMQKQRESHHAPNFKL